MFTWGPKYLFGVSMAALVAAIAYGLVTGGDFIGVLSLGYKGGVGDHFGYAVLIAAFVATQVLCWVLVTTRDGDAGAMAHRAGVDVVPAIAAPTAGSYWGLAVAFAIAAIIVGVSMSMIYFYLGLAVLFVAALMWLLLAWSDRASGDPAVNLVVRDRIADPFEIPVLSVLLVAVVAVGMSRVFLAASAWGAVIAGAVVTILVFGGAVFFSRTDAKPALIRGVVVFGAVAVLAAGIVGAAVGERDFHHGEGQEHGEDQEDGDGTAEDEGDVHSEGEGE